MNAKELPGNLNNSERQEAEFKEFEPRLKFGWFHINSLFQDLSRRLIKTGFWRILYAASILKIRTQDDL